MVLLLLLACGSLREDRCGTGMDFSSAFYGDTEFHAGGDWEGDAEIDIFLDVIDGTGEGSVQSYGPLTFQGKAIPAYRSLDAEIQASLIDQTINEDGTLGSEKSLACSWSHLFRASREG